MLRSKLARGLLAGAALIALLAADQAPKAKAPSPSAKDTCPAFERLKTLAGDWELANSKDEAQRGKTVVRYRVTAGGSAVEETLFPGEAKEMVSIYHRDGNALAMTHYCQCGNQPHMRTKSGEDANQLVFDFAGGSNLNAATDTHMHSLKLRFVDADHLHADWELYVEGKPASVHSFDVVRKK
jgi:hypothetical protein